LREYLHRSGVSACALTVAGPTADVIDAWHHGAAIMRRQIKKLIEVKINPMVASHGGRIDLVDYVDKNVFIEMSGGCQGCSSSAATLKQGVEKILRDAFGDDIINIYDVTDHNSGENPFYN
jgi:Fe-S cluster biogenesis protein NfuA